MNHFFKFMENGEAVYVNLGQIAYAHDNGSTMTLFMSTHYGGGVITVPKQDSERLRKAMEYYHSLLTTALTDAS